MSLSAGSRLGHYEILAPLGAGGMGEVFRARDTRLGRSVAIKVLPQELSTDTGRLRRFEKEAQSASSLNHPNIVTVYDIGSSGSTSYIAMELVDGKTLREILTDGPLPLRRLLQLAPQIADGLARAHEAGIVHRDLKPENLMITRDGFVKILDFGLAKLVQPEVVEPHPTHAPTASAGTEPGTVMGTVGYMSPEQALGKTLDFRSDQFSFGSILYEMTTGKRAFARATRVDTLSAIVHEEPPAIPGLNPAAPAPLRWIVERCLAKEPAERYASTVDLARDLANVREHVSELSGESAGLSPGKRLSGRRLRILGISAAALAIGLAAGFFVRGRGVRRVEAPPMRLDLTFPASAALELGDSPVLALSPDGTALVYVGRRPEGGQGLYLRSTDRFEAAPLLGTEGAGSPFFSPDGRWVGFWADRKMKKVALAGGQPITLCDAAVLRGASWGKDGNILFSPYGLAALWRVSENGGEPKPVTSLDPRRGEKTHRWPEILPGGKAAIFTVHGSTPTYDDARIDLLDLGTGQRRTLVEGGTDARYVPSGHLVYVRAGSLFAVPFDLKRLAVTGRAVLVLSSIGVHSGAGFASYAFSPEGSLFYVPFNPKEFESELVWVDRKGAASPLTDVKRIYSQPRLSSDGRRLAVVAGRLDGELWLHDLKRGSWDRLLAGQTVCCPVWSPDGSRLAFASSQNGPLNTYWIATDRSAPVERVMKLESWQDPTSWSPDGKALLVEDQTPEGGFDISALSTEGDRKSVPLVHGSANEEGGQFSPDGHWIAYQSNESGRFEVYVTAYPGPGGRFQVSTDGGENPVWSRDGREIFFRRGKAMMAAPVDTRTKFQAGLPRALFDIAASEDFDVAPDGRFVFVRLAGEKAPRSLAVVLGWFDDLKRRVAPEDKHP